MGVGWTLLTIDNYCCYLISVLKIVYNLIELAFILIYSMKSSRLFISTLFCHFEERKISDFRCFTIVQHDKEDEKRRKSTIIEKSRRLL